MLDTKATILEYHKQEGDAQASVTPWQVLCSALVQINDSPPPQRRHGTPFLMATLSFAPQQDDVRVITFAVPLTGVPEVIKTAIGEAALFRLCMCTSAVHLFMLAAIQASACRSITM